MSQHLVVLEATTSGAGLMVLESARRLGLQVTFLTRDPERYRHHQIGGSLTDADRVVVVETTSLPHVLACFETLHRQTPVSGLVCLTDACVEAAAQIAERYDLPFMAPGAVALARNKDRTRALCAELELPGPRFALVSDRGHAAHLATEWGYPVILKPARGTGSTNVLLCRTPHELAAAFGQIGGRVLMEEFLRGPLYSLEALTFDGDTTFLGVTDRVMGDPPAFVEVADAFPARLDPDSYHAACDMVGRLLAGAGVTFGVTHTEFILTARGPVLVELNPRLAGGLIGPMISASYGTDIYAQIIRMALGQRPQLPMVPEQGAAEICLYASRPGRVRAVHGVDVARTFPGVQQIVVRARAGDYVQPPVDFRGDYAFLWAVGPNAEMAAARCRAAASAIWLEVES
ncbi:MAG TPA: ATP-grasp domain-containing protein [Symbiobacteriaceae bacterium]|nr:ATP-grasp domain-containing protein [Symbiobacteriaceae bacterium]